MSLMSRLMSRMAKLPPAETHEVRVERNLRVLMFDGVVCLADHYAPCHVGPRPTILMRSPYGERKRAGWIGRSFAEQGFHVLMQSCRGTFGSEGTWDPFRGEREDGLATIAWLKHQRWFNGELATFGSSYSGFTAWAIAHDAGPVLKALSTQITSADFRSMIYPSNAFALEVFAGWTAMTHAQEEQVWRSLASTFSRKWKAALFHLPLGEIDEVAFGDPVPFWRAWLAHEQSDDPWWETSDFHQTVSEVTAPNHLVGGWYDFMLPALFRDYQALVQAGHHPYLTIGPWTHFDVGVSLTGMREAMIWLRAHLLGDRRSLRTAPVRLFVGGANVWRELTAFPPATMKPHPWYLHPEGNLATTVPPASEPDHYRYDPGDPTPSVGGAARAAGNGRGSQDNRALEARADVLTYTSAPLDHDLEIMGPVEASLFVQSSLASTDFFVRVTDVEPSGKSLNVCDGLVRLAPGDPAPQADGVLQVKIELWPTAYRFRSGHRLRLQVASGAFPRWNRNLGTGEPGASATTMKIAEQRVYHDRAHPSHVLLPVVE
jgi:uncharacterized protein